MLFVRRVRDVFCHHDHIAAVDLAVVTGHREDQLACFLYSFSGLRYQGLFADGFLKNNLFMQKTYLHLQVGPCGVQKGNLYD